MMTKRGSLPEIAAVLAACFAPPIGRSLIAVAMHQNLVFNDARLYRTVGYEVVIGIIVAIFLWRRGWRFEHLATDRLNPASIALGLFGALLLYLIYAVAAISLASIMGNWVAGPHIANQTGPLTVGPVIIASIVNPIFEEVFVCAYVVAAFQRHCSNRWVGMHVSVALRIAYHLYQGSVGVVAIAPMGVLFAAWYLKTRRLWPLVTAHAVFDFFPLLSRTM